MIKYKIKLKSLSSSLKITLSCFILSLLMSCESHEQTADNAFNMVKQNKLTNDSLLTQTESKPEPVKIEVIEKTEVLSEWLMLKNKMDKKIRSNEIKIQEILALPGTNVKLAKRISNLQQENNDLKRKLNEYKEEENVRWENFKTLMSHDANNIEIELKDISANIK